MKLSKDEQREQLRQALAAYAGPVTRCPPGQARGKLEFLEIDDAASWLRRHRNDQSVTDPKEMKAERRRKRMEQQQQRQQRDDRRNAPEIRRANRQERIARLRQENSRG